MRTSQSSVFVRLLIAFCCVLCFGDANAGPVRRDEIPAWAPAAHARTYRADDLRAILPADRLPDVRDHILLDPTPLHEVGDASTVYVIQDAPPTGVLSTPAVLAAVSKPKVAGGIRVHFELTGDHGALTIGTENLRISILVTVTGEGKAWPAVDVARLGNLVFADLDQDWKAPVQIRLDRTQRTATVFYADGNHATFEETEVRDRSPRPVSLRTMYRGNSVARL